MYKRTIAFLSLGHLITDINQGLLPIFLTVLKEQLGLSYTSVGIIVLASNISSSFIQPLFGYLSDRYHNYWLLPASCFVAGAGMALIGLTSNFYLILLVVLISGLGISSYHPEASKATHFASGHLQAGAMSYFSVGGNIGNALGPLLAGFLLAQWGIKSTPLLFIPTGLMTLLLWLYLPVIIRTTSEKERIEKTANRARGQIVIPYGNLTLLITVVIFRSWILASLTNYIPLYYVNFLHGEQSYAGTLLFIFLVSGAAGTILGGWAADRWGAKNTIVASMAVLVPLVLLFPRLQGLWLVLVVALAGFAAVSTFAVTIVMAQALLPHNIGMASGLLFGFALGTGGIGVTLIGSIADAWGLPVALTLMAGIPGLGFLLALFLPDLRRSPAQSQ